MNRPKPHPNYRRIGDIAFLVVVFAAYIVYFNYLKFSFRVPDSAILVGLGIVFCWLGLYVPPRLEKSKNSLLYAAFFVAEILLGGIINYLGEGQTYLILLPIASMAVENLPRIPAILACVGAWAAQIVPFYFLAGWNAVSAAGAPLVAAVFFVAVFTQANVNEQKAREALAEANQKLQIYASKVEELAIAQERNRLAREIHDGLGHYLTAINIQIKAAQAVIGIDPSQAQASLNNAQTMTQEALADIRRSVSTLRSDLSTSKPLPTTLGKLLEETNAAGIKAQFSIKGSSRPLSPQVEFTIFRVAQEGLTNIRKHSRANQAELCLDYLDQSVRLTLTDDGIGSEDPTGGFGLVGVQERVQLLQGSFKIDTSPGQGFHLIVELPG